VYVCIYNTVIIIIVIIFKYIYTEQDRATQLHQVNSRTVNKNVFSLASEVQSSKFSRKTIPCPKSLYVKTVQNC